MQHRNNLKLREELSRITKDHSITVDQQEKQIRLLPAELANSIKYVASDRGFDCTMFALGIESESWAKDFFRSREPIGNFAQQAVEELDEKIEKDPWEIIAYWSGNHIEHWARISGDSVISKWGKKGNVWRHGIYEVPMGYGSGIEFFSKADGKRIVEYLENLWNALKNEK